MRAAALALLLGVAPFVSAADLPPATPQTLARDLGGKFQKLQSAQGLRGAFTQKKQLAGIARPLVSGGQFLFVRGKGILWHTQTPFDSEFVLTERRMTVTESGNVALAMQTAEHPGLRLVSDLFLALFALDFDALGRHFDLFAAAGTPWRIGLAPRDAALRVVATRIELKGDAAVSEVVLEDAHGDRTQIVLNGVQHLKTISPAEAERFGP